MPVGVPCLTLSGVAEVSGDVGVALDVGHLGEVQVAAVGLGLAREGGFQVFERLAAVEAHDGTPDSLGCWVGRFPWGTRADNLDPLPQ